MWQTIFAAMTAIVLTAQVAPKTVSAPPSPGRMVDIGGGRELHIDCIGQGSPTVVLEAGLGDSSLVWSLVQPEIAKTARVCSYDRSGTAWSHDAGPEHSLSKAADDLDLLLTAAGEHPPYIMVGHSWGGWLITVYAKRHLQNVASIVLVDSSVGFDPPVIEKMPASGGGGPPAGPLVMKKSSDEEESFKKLPPSVYAAYLWTQTLSRFGDVDDPDEPLATVQAATAGKFPLNDKPLVLIIARHADGAFDQDTEKGKAIRSRILGLSHQSSLVHADSRHHVQLDDPATVVTAIQKLVYQSRN